MNPTWKTRWKTFLSGSSLKILVFKTLNLNLLNTLLPLATSLLIFRFFERNHQGCYRTLLSLLAICELFLAGLDGSLLRFWSSQKVSTEDKKAISQLVFLLKSGTTTLFLIVIFLMQHIPGLDSLLLSQEALAIGYTPYLYLAMGFTLLSSFSVTLSKGFVANQLFGYIFRLTLLREIVLILIVLFLIWIKAPFLTVLLVQLSVYLGLFLVNARYAWNRKENFYIHPHLYSREVYKRVFQTHLKSYSLPISFTSVLTYAKNHLPFVILGKSTQSGLAGVANYHVLREIFLKIHKMSSGYLSYLLPKFVEMYETHPLHFSRRFNQLFWASQSFRYSVWLAMWLLSTPLLSLLKLDPSYHFILMLFSIELITADVATFNAEVIHLKTETRPLFYASLSRAIVEIPCILILTQHYGEIGASLTLLFSRLVESAMLIRYASELNVLRHQKKIFAFLGFITLFFLGIHWKLL